ncbi:MAG: DUF4886 domain-containing protein [Syntrophus sp. (in: bacteria)]
MKILSLLCCLLMFTVGCSPAKNGEAKNTVASLRILFVGNSYTYVNDLPKMFTKLASAGGHLVETGMVAKGGWTLAHHANSSETINTIKASKWDYVVMHEQSQIPSTEASRKYTMYPSAQYLVPIIRQRGSTPIFFLTWAHRNGWSEKGMPDYESMQSQIEQGYIEIAQELNALVAPVGHAWSKARRQYPELELWQGDGSHPSEQGTYLAACVFYAVIFRQSPEGLKYPVNISKENAHSIQKIAASVVLQNPKQWNLP